MEPVVQLEAVIKTYHKNDAAPPVHALRGVDLIVPRGQYLAIMGPSGSGKSTMLNLLGCLDRPTSGRFILDGRDVATLDDESLSKFRGEHLGFVFQAFNLIPQLTVLQNVEVPLFYQGIPRQKRHAMAVESLRRVQLADRMDHRPNELSGGQMQRVAVARALVNKPSFLLADEPTGNLDSVTGQAILGLFEELHRQGLTIIMVTHDESIADRCQRVVRLKDGLVDRDEMNVEIAKA